MKRRLHLHVGLPKTGTTYLQGCLKLNGDWLAEQGFVCAPMADDNGAHHPLARLLGSDGPEAVAAVLDEAAAREAPSRAFVASSEIFCGELTNADMARDLADALAPGFDTVIHITLRRQDHLRESAYAEVARLGARLPPPRPEARPAAREMDGLYENPALETRLAILEQAFGRDAVRVAVYHDAQRRDPFALFCSQLGIEPPRSTRQPPRARNDSLPRRKTLLIAPFEKAQRRYARLVHHAVRDSRCIQTDAPKAILSPDRRRAIVEAMHEENARIVARYAPIDGDWLLQLPTDEPDWFPAAPPRRSEYLGLWVDLMRAALGDGARSLPGRVKDAIVLSVLTFRAARQARRDHAPTVGFD